MFKKILLWLFVTSTLWLWLLWMINNTNTVNATWFWINTEQVSSIEWLWTSEDKGEWLITVIKNFINRTLWTLSLIALILLLRWGRKMLTAAGDETKYKDGFKILKQAAIWLAVIGLSWFIVSMIFWIIKDNSDGV